MFRFWILATVGMTLSACVNDRSFVSVENKFKSSNHSRVIIHRVEKGETLYSIALRYDRDVVDLARANGIRSPYTIYPQQKLRVSKSDFAKPVSPAYPQVADKKLTNSSTATKSAAKYAAANRPVSPKSKGQTASMNWKWPAEGKVVKHFSRQAPINKGIDIAGKLGESVRAAAAGTVVYAGNSLRGYGNLVIIKHNARYLSAYAHNSKILVEEKQDVKAQDKIAEIGSSGAERVKLHFEIRRDGKPVNPLDYLPRL